MSRSRVGRSDAIALVVYVGAAVALGFADFKMRRFPSHVVTDYIPGVLNGSYGAPATYRVLAPYLTHYFTVWTGLEPVLAFVITRLVIIYAALVAIHVYLRVWYSSAASLAGGLAVAAFMPLTFTNNWAHPDSFPELCLFTLGGLAVARGWDALLYPLLVVSTLNRETTAFLVMLWASVRWGTLRPVGFAARLASFAAVWAIVYASLRWWRGLEHYQYWMLDQNLEVLKILPSGFDPYTRIVGYLGLVFLLIPAGLAINGARMSDAPSFFRRALPVALLFVVTSTLFSALAESRIFLPMVPLLLPGAMCVFVEPDRRVNGSGAPPA
jgi:hypothetical protein